MEEEDFMDQHLLTTTTFTMLLLLLPPPLPLLILSFRCVRLDLDCHPQPHQTPRNRLKLHKTRSQLAKDRAEVLTSWTASSSVGDYVKRLKLMEAGNTIALQQGLDSSGSSSVGNPVVNELQGYVKAAQTSYSIIMRLKGEGKVHIGALKTML